MDQLPQAYSTLQSYYLIDYINVTMHFISSLSLPLSIKMHEDLQQRNFCVSIGFQRIMPFSCPRLLSLPRIGLPTSFTTHPLSGIRRQYSTTRASSSGTDASHVYDTKLFSASCVMYTLSIYHSSPASSCTAANPPDSIRPSSITYTEDLENQLQSLPVLKRLREAPDTEDWYEIRPYLHIPEDWRAKTLTAGSLHGPGRLAVSPLLRVKKDETESVGILHLGRQLCGHDGIVHGGMIAVAFDEFLGRPVCLGLSPLSPELR